MTGPKRHHACKLLLCFWVFVAVVPLWAARNAIGWESVNLPTTAQTGQTITFSVIVANNGDTSWGSDHYVALTSETGEHLTLVAVGDTAPGATKTASFALKLPAQPGTYTYEFVAVQHGVEYFGPTVSRAVVVALPPLGVSLDVADDAITVGERTRLLSTVDSAGDVTTHGVEARRIGGSWETWVRWSDDGGEEQTALAGSAQAGIYELRAFAARHSEADVTYSPRAFLTVNDIAPAITTQPVGVVTNVGETVSLKVAVTGSAPIFQWRKDDADLPGATDDTLTLLRAQVRQSGSYTVVVANTAGSVVSRAANVSINPLSLPAVTLEASSFAGGTSKRTVSLNAVHVGDVLSIGATARVIAGVGWRHNVLIRRPAITSATALPPEDGSGFTSASEAWNKDGWGNPFTDGNSYDARVAGQPAVDLGNREPFIHAMAPGESGSTRAIDFVLDAPGTWQLRTEVVDGDGQLIATSATTTITVAAPLLASDPGNLTYPYGRSDRFVGVFWNAGQAHRLWSTWRAEFQSAYAATWAVDWKLMWQPSPYFRRGDGGWLRPTPAPESPWEPFWAGHQVYAMVPDAADGSKLTHDITSRAFADKAAVRLMDVGVDFVAVDYTNQFLEEREDVLPAVSNLADAFQTLGRQSQSGQAIRLSAVVPANIASGDWAGNGGFVPAAIARFNAKLNTLYTRYARFESAWFYLADDKGARKPLLLLWVGASGEGEPDGGLAPSVLAQLKLADGRAITDAFTVRWVGAFLSDNRRFLTGAEYTVDNADVTVTGKYANAKFWSYHERFPSTATIAPGATGATPTVEAITVQPLAPNRDRFGRAWDVNWPAGEGFHYETPAAQQPVPLASYGKTWRDALAAARALNPKFLLTTWAEFGSENDEPRPDQSVTIMDNNKFGTHFGDALRQTVRLFKYQAPTAWIDTLATGDALQWISELPAGSVPSFATNQVIHLQGWMTPNVATTFAGGSVKVFVDDELRGTATIGGAWNGATRWTFDFARATILPGRHTVKVLADDGIGGTSLAGVQFRGEPPRNSLPITATATTP